MKARPVTRISAQSHGGKLATRPPPSPPHGTGHEKTKLIPERRCSPRLAVAWVAPPIRPLSESAPVVSAEARNRERRRERAGTKGVDSSLQ